MSHNPKPIERLIGGWGWWRQPEHAVWYAYRGRFGWDHEIPEAFQYYGSRLTRRGFHPFDAVNIIAEGFAELCLKAGPAGWRGAWTWEQWLGQFPSEGDYGRHRR